MKDSKDPTLLGGGRSKGVDPTTPKEKARSLLDLRGSITTFDELLEELAYLEDPGEDPTPGSS